MRQMDSTVNQNLPLVKSAARVLQIAEILVEHRDGLTLAGLTRELNIPSSSCHALVQTLLARGYLLKDRQSEAYRLSRKWARLAYLVDDSDLIEQAEPVMAEMHRLCSESIGLAVFDDDEMLMVHRKTSRARVRIVNPIGTRLPAYATSLGKAILACWPSEELDAWLVGRTLSPFTPNTIISADRLRACLDEVRREGVAYDLQESAMGILAIGACIRSNENEPVAALSILVLTHGADDSDIWRRLRQLTRTGANTISQAMGCRSVEGPVGLDDLSQIWEDVVGDGAPSWSEVASSDNRSQATQDDEGE